MEEIFDFDSIYPDVQNILETVSIVRHMSDRKPVCILGVLMTEAGLQIEKEMLLWLTGSFDVYCVRQEPPGILFEYPALRFAQWISGQTEAKVLYLHTKGAANQTELQKRVRMLWKHEFTGKRLSLYLDDDADVVCPFIGQSNETWYNGMFISKKAFSKVLICLSDDRYHYQRLFRYVPGIKMNGILKENIDPVAMNTYMMTMDITFSGKKHDFTHGLVWTPKPNIPHWKRNK